MPIENNPSNANTSVEKKIEGTDAKPESSGKFDGRSVKSTPTIAPETSKLMETIKHVKGRLAAHKNIFHRSFSESTLQTQMLQTFHKRLDNVEPDIYENCERELELIIQDVDEYDLDYARYTIALLKDCLDKQLDGITALASTLNQSYTRRLKNIEQQLNNREKNRENGGSDNLQELIEKLNTLQSILIKSETLEEVKQTARGQKKSDVSTAHKESTKVLVNTRSEPGVLESLLIWESQGGEEEQRAEAATRIRQAFNEKSTSLDISELKLSEFPEEIFEITSLEELKVSYNNFDNLPEGFDRLTKLKQFKCNGVDLPKIPESLLSHPGTNLYCWFNSHIPWAGPRDNYLKRDNILIQTFRNRHSNEDGSISVEQGPINLSLRAMTEQEFWVYNEEPITVYRGIAKSPQQVINEDGMHTKALSTEGLVYHVNVQTHPGTKLTGGAISTSLSLMVAYRFSKAGRGYIYKIDLEPKQGVNVSKTCQLLEESGTIKDEVELKKLKKAKFLSSSIEEEISVIGSISLSQISVLDYETELFIPIREWVDAKKGV